LVSITAVDDTALARSRSAAERLLRVMETHEVELAHAAEARLFPDGPPAQVTIASIMRALAAHLMDAAQNLAESDAAYNATLREHRGQRAPSSSLLSQDVAEKIALSVELEELVLRHADNAGARLERKLFPDGLPEQIGLLGIFQALRRRVALATASGDDGGDGDTAPELHELHDSLDSLDREVSSVAQLFAELSEICNLPAPSRQIRDIVDLSEDELGE
jgi:hypothetical protein